MKNSFFFLFVSFLCFNSLSQNIDKGRIFNNVKLKSDTSLSYAIYIPKKVSTNNLVVVFFDPNGNGVYPISLYKNIAEQFGIILIGNNTSKNGMEFNVILSNYSKLMNELYSTYKIESKNVALWGFSGGAKAAMYCANNSKTIQYCIYGGAYLPLQNPIECLGFNGTKDMNYTDLLAYSYNQENIGNNKHLQLEFNSKHAWPDSIVALNAFRWYLLKKMQKMEIPQDKVFIAQCFLSFKTEFDKALSAKKYRQAFIVGKKSILTMDKMFDVSYFKSNVAKIVVSEQFKKEIKTLQANYQKETTTKESYQKDFLNKDSIYWKNEIEKLNQNIKTDKTGINERLLGFLSLAGYSYALQSFNENNIPNLEKILYIYQHADPTNPEQALMRARLFILKKDATQAKSCLQEAIDLGIDKSRIDNDAVLKTTYN